jgi:hypothetical protein
MALGGTPYTWQWVVDVPRHNFSSYAYPVASLYDSMASTSGKHYFFVSSETETSYVFWDSPVDSGYSIDNLSPVPPANPMLIPLADGPIRLLWNKNLADPDVGHYAIYRSTIEGFSVGDETRLTTTPDTTVIDSSVTVGQLHYYRITTADIHGNESAPTAQLAITPVPIQLASFGVSFGPDGSARLEWTTISEVNNFGFYIQRRAESEQNFMDLPNIFIPGNGTTTVPRNYSFTDHTTWGGKWWYRLKQVDLDGAVHFTHAVAVDAGAGKGSNMSPAEYALQQNYPNPFNPSTVIRYALPQKSDIQLAVFNTVGEQVAILVQGQREAGYHEVRVEASSLSSGVYFYRLRAGDIVQMKKMVVLK